MTMYRNSNGNNYIIIAMKKGAGFLVQEFEEGKTILHPYVVADYFDPDVPSWSGGHYFQSYNSAREYFESIS